MIRCFTSSNTVYNSICNHLFFKFAQLANTVCSENTYVIWYCVIGYIQNNVDGLRCGSQVIESDPSFGCDGFLADQIWRTIHHGFDATVAAPVILLVRCCAIMIA